MFSVGTMRSHTVTRASELYDFLRIFRRLNEPGRLAVMSCGAVARRERGT